MSVLLRVAAVVLGLIGVLQAFGWLGVAVNPVQDVGWDGLGLIAFYLSTLVPDGWTIRRGPPQ